MRRIGRNAQCPCGSGKKYKKCCLNKAHEHPTPSHRVMRATHWSLPEIRACSTEQIIKRLRNFGVDFREEQFLQDVHTYYSACDLAAHWKEIYPIKAEGLDVDFIWMAAIVLWERLAAHLVNAEQLGEMIQEGYNLLEESRDREACTRWLEVWEHLKRHVSPEMKSIEEAEKVNRGLQSFSNWCQDLEMELGNTGLAAPSFYEKRIIYCQEFCALFPATDSIIIHNMKRAVAESYFALGMIEQGEQAFADLIVEFPHNAFSYIGWGDMYWLFRMKEGEPPNYEKAAHIYRMALEREVDNRQDVLERLADLEQESKAGTEDQH